MPYLNGFNASIIVNDTEVPHYAVEVDEKSRTLTCWIPSVPGEKFSVTWRCLKGLMDTRGEVYIDGSSAGSEVIRRQIYKGMKGKFSVVEKGNASHPFSFSDLQVDSLNPPSSTPDLGDIRIVIDRIDTSINFDRKRKDRESNGAKRTVEKDQVERIATFIFKYRTSETLQSQGIPSREANYRPVLASPSESSSAALVADSASGQINLPNYKELFTVSSDRATNKRKYEEILAHDDDNLDHEICRLQAQLNELHTTRKTMKRIKKNVNGPGRHRQPRFIYDMLKNGAVKKQEENKSESAV
ncbi:hypothetical protein M413DRAFT_166114 [Hebeloma cylindrosporum]|uniref:DUF7918 domain-containing protein n=1 Tax=Hebeloma cylindrosporum TaxID=76867 RepID=A0A0C3CAR1_HEBCY|nr:hypothetical protein M413DRAFT_166114 [Hebeloma cylindrosporum h7]